MSNSTTGFTLSEWQQAYQQPGVTPDTLLPALRAQLGETDNAWISLASAEQLSSQLQALAAQLEAANGDLAALPLYGVPFAI